MDPSHANALYCLATLKRELNALDDALNYYRRAVASNPNDADAWSEMAAVLTQKRNTEAAEKASERARAIRPSLVPRDGVFVIVTVPRMFS